MNPISMSTASAIPPLLPASSVDWIIAPASMKSRKPLTCGKPGQVDRAAGAAGLDRQQQGREDDDRRHQLRPAEGLADRAAAEGGDHPQVDAAGAGSLGGDRLSTVSRLGGLARRPRGGSRSWRRRRRRGWAGRGPATRPGSRPRPARGRRGATSARPPLELDQDAPSFGGSSLPNRETTSLGALDARPRDPQLQVGAADLGLERRRGALGDDLARVDDPDPVGELVGLLQVLRGEEDRRALVVQLLDLLPDRLARDGVEAGGRLVEEEDLAARARAPRRGRAAGASRPSRCRRAGRRRARGRRGRAAPPPAASPSVRGRPWSVACRRISSRPVISGSSAAS